jgi:tetratricopeptide (TPR) repeat protein
MFFKKFFTKDHLYYLDKGDKCFADERYADARYAFLEALQKVDEGVPGSVDARPGIISKLSETGDRLGLMNLAEAEHALSLGDSAKAIEHLGLVLEFSEDTNIRAKAEELSSALTRGEAPPHTLQAQHNCSGCSSDVDADSAVDHGSGDHLSARERFELFIQTLPEGLPERYSALGEQFAKGYLLVHDGEERAGAVIFQELLGEAESDILLYELALIHYRNGNAADCEKLLRRAIEVNDANPLCYLGLVQLLADTGRAADTIPLLNYMVDHTYLIEQALIFLGDVYQKLGDEEEAMGGYSRAIGYPAAAKTAAERLVPLLQKHGRQEEAVYLVKKYLKGCC